MIFPDIETDYDARPDDPEAYDWNQTRIQLALDEHAQVLVPPRGYTTGGLKVRDYQALEGCGWASHLIAKPNLAVREHLIQPRDYLSRVTVGVKIRNLRLSGNSAGQNNGGPMTSQSNSHHGVALLQAWHCTLEDLWIDDFDGDGWYAGVTSKTETYGSNWNTIRNLLTEACTRNGGMISRGCYNTIDNWRSINNQTGMNKDGPKYSPWAYQSAEFDIEPNFPEHAAAFNTCTNFYFRSRWSKGVQITRPGTDTQRNTFARGAFEDCADEAFYIKSPGAVGCKVVDSVFKVSDPALSRRHLRACASLVRIERNEFIGSTRESPISIDDGAGGKGPAPYKPVIRFNTMDFTGSGVTEAQVRSCNQPVTSPNEIATGTLTVA